MFPLMSNLAGNALISLQDNTSSLVYDYDPIESKRIFLMLGFATGISAGSIVGKLRSKTPNHLLTYLPYVAVASTAMVTAFTIVTVFDVNSSLLTTIYAISTFSSAYFVSWDISN